MIDGSGRARLDAIRRDAVRVFGPDALGAAGVATCGPISSRGVLVSPLCRAL